MGIRLERIFPIGKLFRYDGIGAALHGWKGQLALYM